MSSKDDIDDFYIDRGMIYQPKIKIMSKVMNCISERKIIKKEARNNDEKTNENKIKNEI